MLFLFWQLRSRFYLFGSTLTILSHENTGWLSMPFSLSFGQSLFDPETSYIALRRRELSDATCYLLHYRNQRVSVLLIYTTACFFLSTTAVSRTIAIILYILKSNHTS